MKSSFCCNCSGSLGFGCLVQPRLGSTAFPPTKRKEQTDPDLFSTNSSQALATARARPEAGSLSRIRRLSSSLPATFRTCLSGRRKHTYGDGNHSCSSLYMASGQLSRAEALACSGCRHACHVMLYCDTNTLLFGSIPIRHIVLPLLLPQMQMRFDGLLGFPGGFVNLSEESLEAGLGRELLEELGVAFQILEEDHVDSCFAPASSPASSTSPRLITHFYTKKMEEGQIRAVETAAVTTATDHGQEVLGMVRVPLHSTKGGGGLASFLSHSFVGNARFQLLHTLLRLHLVAPEELREALARSLKIQARASEELRAALARVEGKTNLPHHSPAHTG
uniref:U8 snoRNA-decapping enzyme n=1 Tax=Gasterosteus aculeatus aculeatus TaxID=481459 RepID=A0AAQ4R7C4_GASAC